MAPRDLSAWYSHHFEIFPPCVWSLVIHSSRLDYDRSDEVSLLRLGYRILWLLSYCPLLLSPLLTQGGSELSCCELPYARATSQGIEGGLPTTPSWEWRPLLQQPARSSILSTITEWPEAGPPLVEPGSNCGSSQCLDFSLVRDHKTDHPAKQHWIPGPQKLWCHVCLKQLHFGKMCYAATAEQHTLQPPWKVTADMDMV